jgi:hypothetical protein
MEAEGLRAGADAQPASSAFFQIDPNRRQPSLWVDLRSFGDAIESTGFDASAAALAELWEQKRFRLDLQLGDFRFHTFPNILEKTPQPRRARPGQAWANLSQAPSQKAIPKTPKYCFGES